MDLPYFYLPTLILLHSYHPAQPQAQHMPEIRRQAQKGSGYTEQYVRKFGKSQE